MKRGLLHAGCHAVTELLERVKALLGWVCNFAYIQSIDVTTGRGWVHEKRKTCITLKKSLFSDSKMTMMSGGACCALTHKPLLLSRALSFWRQQPTPLQFQRCSPSSSSSSSLHPRPSPFNNSTLSFNRTGVPFTQPRLRNSRLSALSGDGSGGTGGSGGGSGGDSNSGGNDGGGGESWSFLSW